jgi:hypothetical protein
VPALPWRVGEAPDPGTTYVAMVSALPLAQKRATGQMFRYVLKVRQELDRAPGLVGYALEAHPFGGRYFTISAWTDQASLRRFVGMPDHAAAMVALQPALGETSLATWDVLGSDLPLTWAEGKARLPG